MFEAEMWPQRRPKPKKIAVSLTKPVDSTGFQKGLPERVIEVDRPGLGRPGYPSRLLDVVSPSGDERLWRPGLPRESQTAARTAPGAVARTAPGAAPRTAPGAAPHAAPPAAPPAASQGAPRPSEPAQESLGSTSHNPAAQGLEDSPSPDLLGDLQAIDDALREAAGAMAHAEADAAARHRAAGAEPMDLTGRHIFDDDSLREVREQARAEGRAEGLTEGDRRGFARGLEEGRLHPSDAVIASIQERYRAACMSEARQTLEAEIRAKLEAPIQEASGRIQKLTAELARAARDTSAFYEPLKRLALHLAEQLVRSELTVSPAKLSQLIDRCLAEFGQTTLSPLTISLNAQDYALLRESSLSLPAQAELRQDDTLSRGSVRVAMNGAVIEDLIETRYKALWRSLCQDESAEPPPSFLKSVELVKDAFANEVIDAE